MLEAETWTDERLVRKMAEMAETEGTDKLLLLSKELFPGHDEPLNREAGWWYDPKERVSYRKCKQCQSAKLTEDYNDTTRGVSRAECKSCEDENAARRKRRDKDLICVYWFSYRNRYKPVWVYISGVAP